MLLDDPTTGDTSPSPPVVFWAFAPREPVELVDHNGHQFLGFPVDPRWLDNEDALDSPVYRWEGWGRVDIDPTQAGRDYLGLRDAEGARRFAQQWGPLWICAKHRERICYWAGTNVGGHRWVPVEKVSTWLDLAHYMRLLIGAAERLRDDEPLSPDDWRALELGDEAAEVADAARYVGDDLTFQRIKVTALVNAHMARHRVSPHLSPTFGLRMAAGWSVLGAIWLQVAVACAGGGAYAWCDGCSIFYTRRRAAKRRQHNYCDTCNAKGARQKAYYRRKRRDP